MSLARGWVDAKTASQLLSAAKYRWAPAMTSLRSFGGKVAMFGLAATRSLRYTASSASYTTRMPKRRASAITCCRKPESGWR